MAEVVPLNPPKGDPELVEMMRTLLSEAQNARIKSFAIVYVTDEGSVADSHFYASVVDQIALESFFKEASGE
jgi:hypothetical protein